jgi:D-alanyl-D-alanine carboxypeptidase/D-alanyl-D-alanine-endopeptidase (penicillin-binding protein 4)
MLAASSYAELATRIDQAVASGATGRMKVGIHVTLMPSGRVLYARRSGEQFIPASNVKIVTSASALHHLSRDFTFRTIIWADGRVLANGVLEGDLVIQGDGDPNISGRLHGGDVSFLPRTWARALLERGIRRVTGDLVADDRVFDRQYTCPSWPADQLHKWYAAPVAGLSFNDNCLDIIVSPSRDGRVVRLRLEPDSRYFTVSNQLITTAQPALVRQDPMFLSRHLGTNRIILRGKCHLGSPPERHFVTVHEPPMYLATVLAEEMARAGITIDGKVRLAGETPPDSVGGPQRVERRVRVAPTDPRVRVVHSSSITDAVKVMGKNSQSFYAEQLLKRTGAACYGKGSFATGVKAAEGFLEVAGIKPGSYVMADGGGLSRLSRFSPEQFTTVLRHAYGAGYGKDYVASFSLSGIDGSMEKRLAEPAYRGRIAAKTGTLRGVVGLSGFAFNRRGQVLAFSILVNNSDNNWAVRGFSDEICRALVDEEIPGVTSAGTAPR